MKKITALFFGILLLALSGEMIAKERQGARILVNKVDGQRIEGVLIAVKKRSLLLLDWDQKDVSVEVEKIKFIKIIGKSNMGGWRYTRAFFGEGIGTSTERPGMLEELDQAEIEALGVGISLLTGGFTGWAFGVDTTFFFEGKSEAELEPILKKLRRIARVSDYK